MTFDKTCVRCGTAFVAKNDTAKYCLGCRPEVQKEHARKYNDERKRWTARANEIAGRTEFSVKTLRPCRCGTPARPVVGYGFPADGTVTRHVFCTQCGRQGPDAQTAAGAVVEWNKEAAQ